MANWNGLIASLTKDGSDADNVLTGTSSVTPVNVNLPAKYFTSGQFAVRVLDGVSGTFAVNIVGGIGACNILIAGRTNITTTGSFPIPLVKYVGQSSGTVDGIGIPRPTIVQFISAEDVSGFTASVYFAGSYE